MTDHGESVLWTGHHNTSNAAGILTVTHWNGKRVSWIRGVEDSHGERGRCGHLVAEGRQFYGGSCWDCMDRDERALIDSVDGDLSKLLNSSPVHVCRSRTEYERLRATDIGRGGDQ